jgi:hypothetical protein
VVHIDWYASVARLDLGAHGASSPIPTAIEGSTRRPSPISLDRKAVTERFLIDAGLGGIVRFPQSTALLSGSSLNRTIAVQRALTYDLTVTTPSHQ